MPTNVVMFDAEKRETCWMEPDTRGRRKCLRMPILVLSKVPGSFAAEEDPHLTYNFSIHLSPSPHWTIQSVVSQDGMFRGLGRYVINAAQTLMDVIEEYWTMASDSSFPTSPHPSTKCFAGKAINFQLLFHLKPQSFCLSLLFNLLLHPPSHLL